jgi:branched-chain amino acid transport system ATP-binding protein
MSNTLLDVQNLKAGYGDFQALFGIDFTLAASECVAVIGANGAGKSTFLRTLVGMLPSKGQTINFSGENIAGLAADRIHKLGLALVPEGRRLFRSLSVEENLQIGAMSGRKGHWTLKRIYELFPDLYERRRNAAPTLSGGQQQMVAIGRALMSNPALLACDELSLGLSPRVVRDIYAALPTIRAQGTATIVVEQDINQALAVSDRFYCFQEGRVTLVGKPADHSLEAIADAYFGKREAA